MDKFVNGLQQLETILLFVVERRAIGRLQESVKEIHRVGRLRVVKNASKRLAGKFPSSPQTHPCRHPTSQFNLSALAAGWVLVWADSIHRVCEGVEPAQTSW